ncbi:MAG: hypothetical protein ACREGJ_00180 [Candidatus Saccharimonadales bacterium]
MSGQFERYTTPPPLCREPGFIRDTRELVEENGGIAQAVAETFEQANITVEVDGDVSQWSNAGQGAILVGDHRNGVEYAPLLAVFGNMGREDMRFVAKPFSMQARVMGSLGLEGAGLTLLVIPGTLASNRKDKINRDLCWRIANRGNLPTKDEIKTLNADTLQGCADLAESGHAVTLYPTGGVMDATKKPWQRGLGRVIKQLPAESRDSVAIVPFRFDDFSKLRLIRSLTMASRGVISRPQTITLRTGKQGTVNEVLAGATDELTADEITAVLRKQFITAFGELEH